MATMAITTFKELMDEYEHLKDEEGKKALIPELIKRAETFTEYLAVSALPMDEEQKGHVLDEIELAAEGTAELLRVYSLLMKNECMTTFDARRLIKKISAALDEEITRMTVTEIMDKAPTLDSKVWASIYFYTFNGAAASGLSKFAFLKLLSMK